MSSFKKILNDHMQKIAQNPSAVSFLKEIQQLIEELSDIDPSLQNGNDEIVELLEYLQRKLPDAGQSLGLKKSNIHISDQIGYFIF